MLSMKDKQEKIGLVLENNKSRQDKKKTDAMVARAQGTIIVHTACLFVFILAVEVKIRNPFKLGISKLPRVTLIVMFLHNFAAVTYLRRTFMQASVVIISRLNKQLYIWSNKILPCGHQTSLSFILDMYKQILKIKTSPLRWFTISYITFIQSRWFNTQFNIHDFNWAFPPLH